MNRRTAQEATVAFRKVMSGFPSEHDSLILAVYQEINNPDYLDLRHGARHTRNKGCTGPLCQKAVRDQRLQYRRTTNQQAGRTTRRQARSPKYVAMDPVLETIKLAYDEVFDRAYQVPAELQTAGAA